MSSPESVLREYWPDLVFGLTDVEMIIDYLYTDRVITAEKMEALHREPNPKEKIRKLLSHVTKRARSGTHTAFPKFLAVLDRSGNGHLAEQLREAARHGVPAHSPPPQRSLSQRPVTRTNSESAVTATQTSSTNTTAEQSESITSSDN